MATKIMTFWSFLSFDSMMEFSGDAAAQKHVYLQKPESIGELVECVKQFSSSYDQERIRRVAMNVVKRARMCLRADGGHFQHLL